MYFWKWKPQIINETNKREITLVQEQNTHIGNETNYASNMNTSNTYSNQTIPMNFVSKEEHRKNQNNHLLERGTMIQKSINPFLHSTNYIEDLETEAKLLRPMNSNFQ